MLARLQALRGIFRSLRIYHGNRGRRAAMDRLYSRFVRPGDLVFDIGAHVGDRIGSFRRLGAHVVALEPQPGLVRVLRWMYGRDKDVTILQAAVGRTEAPVTINLNPDNPTIATASRQFIDAAKDAAGWEGQRWSGVIEVPGITLDALIARHGRPAFVKIDVEGYELQVLRRLSRPLRALSFEYVPGAIDRALPCLDRLQALGPYRFNVSVNESLRFALPGWVAAEQLADWLRRQTVRERPGDVYARLTSLAA
jgi:FkbM family methyltransferase